MLTAMLMTSSHCIPQGTSDGPIVRKRSSIVTSANMPPATRDLVYNEDLMTELARVEKGVKLVRTMPFFDAVFLLSF